MACGRSSSIAVGKVRRGDQSGSCAGVGYHPSLTDARRSVPLAGQPSPGVGFVAGSREQQIYRSGRGSDATLVSGSVCG